MYRYSIFCPSVISLFLILIRPPLSLPPYPWTWLLSFSYTESISLEVRCLNYTRQQQCKKFFTTTCNSFCFSSRLNYFETEYILFNVVTVYALHADKTFKCAYVLKCNVMYLKNIKVWSEHLACILSIPENRGSRKLRKTPCAVTLLLRFLSEECKCEF